MALPLTRNRTYGNGTKVHPSDINDLQDCIIAGKHGEISLVLPPAAFAPMPVANASHGGGAGFWSVTGVVWFNAWLPVPPGSVITEIVWGFNRGGAGSIILELWKKNPTTAALTLVTTSTVNTGAAFATHTQLPAYTVEADYGVFLNAKLDNVAQVFHGARAKVTKP